MTIPAICPCPSFLIPWQWLQKVPRTIPCDPQPPLHRVCRPSTRVHILAPPKPSPRCGKQPHHRPDRHITGPGLRSLLLWSASGGLEFWLLELVGPAVFGVVWRVSFTFCCLFFRRYLLIINLKFLLLCSQSILLLSVIFRCKFLLIVFLYHYSVV